MSKASDKAMDELHGQLANVLKDALVKTDESGLPISSILNVARQFLKDNDIKVGPGVAAGPLADLADLPVFGEDENVVPIRKEG